jgi:hypothetical protein
VIGLIILNPFAKCGLRMYVQKLTLKDVFSGVFAVVVPTAKTSIIVKEITHK